MTALIGVKTDRTYTSTTLLTEGTGFGLGDRYTDHSGNTWVFVQASSSITQYDAVRIDVAHRASQITIDTGKQALEVAFAQVAFAPDEYGWAQVTGRPQIRLASACQPSLALYATATGGVLDDATVSTMIQGVVATTSVTVGSTVAATCVAQFPTVVRAVVLGAV